MENSGIQPERLSRTEITDRQNRRLTEMLCRLVPANPFWTRKYAAAGVDVASIRGIDDLSRLPVTTKSEIVADHTAHAPYGSNLTFPIDRYSRLHQTSGTTGAPLRCLDTPESWDWFMECWAQIYRLVGLTPDDRCFFPFSFGPFIGFWAAFEGACRLGNLAIPGGGMSSQARLQMILTNEATVLGCTPTYAMRLAEVAAEEGIDLAGGSVRALIVAGEPGGGIPSIRDRIESAWGARVFDHWGMTEIGSLAVECESRPRELLMLEGECIAEIVDPQTLEPLPLGDEGELLITNLGRVGCPLIRYRTGDLVRAATSSTNTGLDLLRLDGGILGRADDMFTVRGNNVFPSSIEAVVREFDAVAEYRIELLTERAMQHVRLSVEPTPGCSQAEIDQLVGDIGNRIKDRLNFNAEVSIVESGSLPRFELKGRRFIRRQA
ncbi:MAG: AMP-binding protein [Planctomycetota bacterium]|nr:AMP-binding protein [Planctomycetota bacterium]